jgi:hypothetical protein
MIIVRVWNYYLPIGLSIHVSLIHFFIFFSCFQRLLFSSTNRSLRISIYSQFQCRLDLIEISEDKNETQNKNIWRRDYWSMAQGPRQVGKNAIILTKSDINHKKLARSQYVNVIRKYISLLSTQRSIWIMGNLIHSNYLDSTWYMFHRCLVRNNTQLHSTYHVIEMSLWRSESSPVSWLDLSIFFCSFVSWTNEHFARRVKLLDCLCVRELISYSICRFIRLPFHGYFAFVFTL